MEFRVGRFTHVAINVWVGDIVRKLALVKTDAGTIHPLFSCGGRVRVNIESTRNLLRCAREATLDTFGGVPDRLCQPPSSMNCGICIDSRPLAVYPSPYSTLLLG